MANKYYVSLVKDLLYCYLVFEAESEEAVHLYLASEYLVGGVWKLPWCSIYEEIPQIDKHCAIEIEAQCGFLKLDHQRRKDNEDC